MINNVLELLIAERDKLSRAIAALQAEPARRGRPPRAQGRSAGSSAPKARRRGGMSAEARKAQSARMKAYWAKRRKQKA